MRSSHLPPLPSRVPVTNAQLRRLYTEATAPGSPLETVRSASRNPLASYARTDFIRRRMFEGPATGFPPEHDLQMECPKELQPHFKTLANRTRNSSEPSNRPPLAVLDVRTMDRPHFNGSKQHAAQLLSILCPFFHAEGIPFSFLSTDPEHPPGNLSEWTSLTEPWRPDHMQRATAYFNFDPLADIWSAIELPYLTHPDTWTCGVWLDAIMGSHPRSFFHTPLDFWAYQVSLQKLSVYDDLLCISETSRSEARHLFGPDMSLHLVPCRVAVSETPAPPPNGYFPADRYVLSIGNALPHKNLACAVAGFAGAWPRLPHLEGLILVAGGTSKAQTRALVQLATDSGLPRHALQIHRQVGPDDIASLLGHAAATIVPSYHEGFSLPVVESLLRDTPVCLSDIPAHRELLGDSGAWFAPDRPDLLARELTALLQNRESALEIQRKALRRQYHPEITRQTLPTLCTQRILSGN